MISRDRNHSEGLGWGVNGCLEPFRKIIRCGTLTLPLEKFDKDPPHQFIWISCSAQYSILEIDPRL